MSDGIVVGRRRYRLAAGFLLLLLPRETSFLTVVGYSFYRTTDLSKGIFRKLCPEFRSPTEIRQESHTRKMN